MTKPLALAWEKAAQVAGAKPGQLEGGDGAVGRPPLAVPTPKKNPPHCRLKTPGAPAVTLVPAGRPLPGVRL